MTIPRKMLCGFYAVIAVAALIATWVQNAAYFPKGAGFLKDFALDLKANPATRSISADIALFMLAAVVFMVIEARRHGIPYVWAYVLGGMLIAISVTFPLFLIARERKLADADRASLRPLDAVLLAVFTAVAAGLVIFTGMG